MFHGQTLSEDMGKKERHLLFLPTNIDVEHQHFQDGHKPSQKHTIRAAISTVTATTSSPELYPRSKKPTQWELPAGEWGMLTGFCLFNSCSLAAPIVNLLAVQ